MLRRLPRWVLRREPMGERPAELRRARATSRPTGPSAARFRAARLQQAGEVRARPQAVHVGLAGAGLAADQQADERLAVVDVDLGRELGRRRRRRCAACRRAAPRSAGRCVILRRRPRGRSARPATLEHASRPTRRDRRPATVRVVIGSTSAMSVERAPAPPQAERVPVDETDRLVGHERVTRRASARASGRSGGRRTQVEAGAAAGARHPAAR